MPSFEATVSDTTEPTEAQLQASSYEFFALVFLPSSGATTQAQADAAIDTSIVGSDIVFTVHTANVDGTIVMQGAYDLLPDDTYNLTLWTDVKV